MAICILMMVASNEIITKLLVFVSLCIVVAIFEVYSGKLYIRQYLCFGRKINVILRK